MTDHNDNSFAQFELPAALFTNLVKMGFNRPTPVQEQAIPFALEGRDILGSAQTGTGKTAAFAIPMVAKLMEDPTAAALVMTPTRELAAQILAVVHQLLGAERKNGANGIRTALLIGGESMGRQFDQLRFSPRIIIGTPGRLNDHLRRDASLLEAVKVVVLDEADRMLDMGFSGQIDEVLENVSKPCQMLMFSATFPPAIIKFSKTYLNNPQRITIAPEQRTAARIQQDVVHTSDANKYDTLVKELDARTGSIIVFVRTKHGADRLAKRLSKENHSADAIHGDLRQRQRDRAIDMFRNRKIRIMVATDVAARGIDVSHIEHVINFDLPQVAEDYIHRIGRTARAGAEGRALSILVPSDSEKWTAISRILNPGAPKQKVGEGGGAFEGKGRSPKSRKGKGGERSYKREGGFNNRKAGEGYSAKKGGDKPFKRRDEEFNEEGREERPASKKKSFDKKPYAKKEFGDKPRFEKRGDREERGNREDRPFKKGGFENRKPREDRGGYEGRGNREDRPFKKDGFENRKPREDRGGYEGRGNREDRPFKKDGFESRKPREDRPFKKDGFESRKPREDRGGYEGRGNREDRPFKKDGFESRKPREDRGGYEGRGNREDRPFKKGGFENRKPREDRGGYEGRGDREERSFRKHRGEQGFERGERPQHGEGKRGFGGGGKFHDGDKPRGKSFGGGKKSFGDKPRGGKGFDGQKEGGARRGAGRFNKGGKKHAAR